jgi:hypothetical protein
MMTVYLILLAALVGWKGWKAWRRGRRQWLRDMTDYRGLWEYLLANGTPEREARRIFLRRAWLRAYRPLLRQWRLWLVVAVIGVVVAVLLR